MEEGVQFREMSEEEFKVFFENLMWYIGMITKQGIDGGCKFFCVYGG